MVVDDAHVVATRDHVLVVYMMLSWRGGTKLLVTVNRSRPPARPHQHGITVLSILSWLNNSISGSQWMMILWRFGQSAGGGRRAIQFHNAYDTYLSIVHIRGRNLKPPSIHPSLPLRSMTSDDSRRSNPCIVGTTTDDES
jgi:hypothetical protein